MTWLGSLGAALLGASALAVLSVAGCSDRSRVSEIRFVDATNAAGFDYEGATYAAAAADFDRDGWEDLAVSNHGQIRLFRNLGDGTFSDVSSPEMKAAGDTHGVAWVDLDDNGLWDLFVSIGAALGRGVGGNRAYLNRGGRLVAAPQLDPVIEYVRGRGRCACPVDVDLDGRLDLVLMNAYQPDRGQRLARRHDGRYVDIAPATGWTDVPWECVVVVHLDDSSDPLYLAGVALQKQPRAFRRDAGGIFRDVTQALGLAVTESVSAMAPGDFDNDGDLDLYVVTGGGVPEGVEVNGNQLLFRMISLPPGVLKGFRFTSTGTLTPTILVEGTANPNRVLLGRHRVPLARANWNGDPAQPVLEGRPEVNPETDRGVFLWRDEEGVLTLWFAGNPSDLWETSGRIDSVSSIHVIERQNLMTGAGGSRNHLFQNRRGRFEDVTDIAGVGGNGSSVDAAFADFDNDGDLDLYVVNGREAFFNPPDTLYRNNGDGTFTDVTSSAMLGGPVAGRGDGVVVLDYDRDGDLDLFTINGRGPPPGNAGPYRLWRNDTDKGRWVDVNLSGKPGNRPAFGARITARFGNSTLRLERYASTDRFATSILPFHIGLGSEEEVVLTVVWPSGKQQVVRARAASEVTLKEPE